MSAPKGDPMAPRRLPRKLKKRLKKYLRGDPFPPFGAGRVAAMEADSLRQHDAMRAAYVRLSEKLGAWALNTGDNQ